MARRAASPLLRAAFVRVLGEPLHAVLLVAILGLMTAAALSEPLYLQHSGNSAFGALRTAIPPYSAPREDAVVRLISSRPPKAEPKLLAGLDAVPNLGATDVSAGSVGYELDISATYDSEASAGARQLRTRTFAVDRPAERLQQVESVPGRGVWLSVATARGLGVAPGDTITLTVSQEVAGKQVTRSTRVRCVGSYRTATGTTTPLDASGSTLWQDRHGQLPTDPRTQHEASLIVADPTTALAISRATGDPLQWVAQRRLSSGASLDQAAATAREVAAFSALVQSQPLSVDGPAALQDAVVSGIPELVTTAQAEVDSTSSPVRSLAISTSILGLICLLGITAMTARRRREEFRQAAFIGVRPRSLATYGMAETLAPLVIAVAAVLAIAAALGPSSGTAYRNGVRLSLELGVGALVLVGATTFVAALVWRRPELTRTASGRGRAIVSTAVSMSVGAVVVSAFGHHSVSTSGVLALIVPLLTLLSAGAVCGYVLSRGAALAARRLGVPGQNSRRRMAARLALRRLATSGLVLVLFVAGLAAALGMVLFAVVSASATDRAVADRTAVAAGARTTAGISGSALLDPSAPSATRPKAQGHDPRTPAGSTVVWTSTIDTIVERGQRALLVFSPASFDGAALWGEGSELAQARSAARTLAAQPAGGTYAHVGVIAVGDPSFSVGDEFTSQLGENEVVLEVVGRADVFPGLRVGLVTTSAALFPRLGSHDPRLVPPGTLTGAEASGFTSTIWSRGSPQDVQRWVGPTTPLGTFATSDQIAGGPAFRAARDAAGYRTLLSLCLVALGLVGLVLFANRLAAASRVSDLMLARAGLRSSGSLLARTLEIAGWAIAGAGAAVVSLVVLNGFLTRLLEFAAADDRPALQVDLTGTDVALVIAAALGLTAVLLATMTFTARRRPALEALRGE